MLAKKSCFGIGFDDVFAIHKIILQKIDDRNAGVFCQVMVRIMGASTIFPNYAKVPFLMVDFMDWLHSCNEHPIMVAALAHYKLVMIHPFIDGNGRTARLLMNLLLLQQGYPLAIIKKEKRAAYINAIETARKTDDFVTFYELILEAVESTLDSYLHAVRESNIS